MTKSELLKKAFDQAKDGIKALAKTLTGEGSDAEKVETAGKLLVKTVEDLEATATEVAAVPEGEAAPASADAPAEGEGGEGGADTPEGEEAPEGEATTIEKKVATLEKTVVDLKKYADMYVSAQDLAELLKQLKEGVDVMNTTAVAMVKSNQELEKTLKSTVVSKQLHKTEEEGAPAAVFGNILG